MSRNADWALLAALAILAPRVAATQSRVTIEVDTPMSPPPWAVMERQLLQTVTRASEEFFRKYFDDRGYLLCVERWGSLDGPDDAPENMSDWPLLYALGAPDEMLRMFKKGWEGHLRQYTAAKQKDVPFAREGMYHKEFHVMFDQAHIAEGLWAFYEQGLADPHDAHFAERARRFAGFYLNEDPEAPNYDPKYKIIRSLFNGSRGPLLRKATPVEWAGDPVETGRFTLLHGERNYQEMLDHFKDYGDIVGDHPVNLMATMLALNAYMLAHEAKYKKWLLEYADAWVQRTLDNHGIIPTNIGLDGAIGGAAGGKWYGGVWGWGFSPVLPHTGKAVHRNNAGAAIAGLGNAFFLTRDNKYLDVWRRMLRQVNANKKVVDGVEMYPHMYGDRGWYDYTPQKYDPGVFEIWYWTMKPEDRAQVPLETITAQPPTYTRVKTETPEAPWLRFLEGNNPNYPVEALQREFEQIRSRIAAMRVDSSTPQTRLSDHANRYNPATAEALTQLMLGGRTPRVAQPLFCVLRYFDPARRRAGVPEDVAALVEKVSDAEVVVTLVNLNPLAAREVEVQGGAYGEHELLSATLNGRSVAIGGPSFTTRLSPGCGSRLVLKTKRYAHNPTLLFPWEERQQ